MTDSRRILNLEIAIERLCVMMQRNTRAPPMALTAAEQWSHEAQTVMDMQGAEIEQLRATLDATLRILIDDRLPLQSRVNDARSILSR